MSDTDTELIEALCAASGDCETCERYELVNKCFAQGLAEGRRLEQARIVKAIEDGYPDVENDTGFTEGMYRAASIARTLTAVVAHE